MGLKEEKGLNCNRDCKGNCCRFMVFPIWNLDHATFCALHDIRVFYNPKTHEYRGLIEKQCKYLTEDGKCSVYNKPERPQLCNEFWCDLMDNYEEIPFD